MNGFPTSDKFNSKTNCFLCSNKQENIKHLIVECPFSKNLFRSLPSSTNLNASDWNFDRIIMNDFDTAQARIAISKLKYVIWWSRNKRRIDETAIDKVECKAKALLKWLIMN